MKTTRFEVLSQEEVECIHAASMEVLSAVGVQVEWKPARDIFGQAVAGVDDESRHVRIPEAPEQFTLYGPGPGDTGGDFRMEIGGGA